MTRWLMRYFDVSKERNIDRLCALAMCASVLVALYLAGANGGVV